MLLFSHRDKKESGSAETAWEEFLTTLAAVTGYRQYQMLADQWTEEENYAENTKEDITMYNIAAELENRGMQRGIQTGMQ